MKRLWPVTSGDYSFEDLCDDGAATAFDAVKEEESIPGESISKTKEALFKEALSKEAPEASKAPTIPCAARYLALKKGKWEHKQLLTSGMILLAMTPRLYARYEAYKDPVQSLTMLESDHSDKDQSPPTLLKSYSTASRLLPPTERSYRSQSFTSSY